MIQCEVSEKALRVIDQRQKDYPTYLLKFVYDIVGCGCVNDGVIYLALVENIDPNRDIKVKSNTIPIFIEKRYEVYYEEKLILDYNQAYQCFQLKSPNQYLNPRMKFVVETEHKSRVTQVD